MLLMVEKREGRHGIFLSWLQVFGLLLIFGGIFSVLATWNAYLLLGAMYMGWYYTPLYYGGYLLIAVGVFMMILGEFRKNL